MSHVNSAHPGPRKGMFAGEHRKSGGLEGYVHGLIAGIRLVNRASRWLNGNAFLGSIGCRHSPMVAATWPGTGYYEVVPCNRGIGTVWA